MVVTESVWSRFLRIGLLLVPIVIVGLADVYVVSVKSGSLSAYGVKEWDLTCKAFRSDVSGCGETRGINSCGKDLDGCGHVLAGTGPAGLYGVDYGILVWFILYGLAVLLSSWPGRGLSGVIGSLCWLAGVCGVYVITTVTSSGIHHGATDTRNQEITVGPAVVGLLGAPVLLLTATSAERL